MQGKGVVGCIRLFLRSNMSPEVPGYNPDNTNKNEPAESKDAALDQTGNREVDRVANTEEAIGERQVVPVEITTLDDLNQEPPTNQPAFTRGRTQRIALPSSARRRGIASLQTGLKREISIGAAPSLKVKDRADRGNKEVKDPGIETMKTVVQSILEKYGSTLMPVINRADSPGRTKRYTLELRQPKHSRGKLPGHGMRFTATGREILRDLEEYLKKIN